MRLRLTMVILAIGACGQSEPPERDEVGFAPEHAAWQVDEVVRIGTVAGPDEYSFNRVADVAHHADGDLYVLDQGDRAVRTYDSEGQHVRTFGGEGEGPGEFRMPLGLAVSGDSVVVYDALLTRLTYFDLTGRVIGSVPVALSPLADGFAQALVPAGEGWAIVLATGCRTPRPDDPRPRWKLALLTRTGASEIVIDEVADSQLALYGEQGCSSLPALARPARSVAFDSRGFVYTGHGDRYEITVAEVASLRHDSSPAPVRVVARETPAPRLSTPDVEAYERTWLEADRPEPHPFRIATVRAAWDSLGYPERWPYFDALHVDSAEQLWVGRSGPDVDPKAWDVFDPDGLYIGTVETPPDVEILDIVGPMIWGLTRDEFDVDYVVGLSIRGWPTRIGG